MVFCSGHRPACKEASAWVLADPSQRLCPRLTPAADPRGIAFEAPSCAEATRVRELRPSSKRLAGSTWRLVDKRAQPF